MLSGWNLSNRQGLRGSDTAGREDVRVLVEYCHQTLYRKDSALLYVVWMRYCKQATPTHHAQETDYHLPKLESRLTAPGIVPDRDVNAKFKYSTVQEKLTLVQITHKTKDKRRIGNRLLSLGKNHRGETNVPVSSTIPFNCRCSGLFC